jgi:hypothetical protein
MLRVAMKKTNKKSLKAVVAEFRRCIAHYRAQGASEERIRQVLGEAIHGAFHEVKTRRNGRGFARNSIKPRA